MDTWGALRQLANAADQSLSATFLRDLLRTKRGVGDQRVSTQLKQDARRVRNCPSAAGR